MSDLLTPKHLHNYQKKGVMHLLKKDKAGLFLDMGLGKTVTALTAIKCLIYSDLAVANVLIMAPKRVIESVWEREAQKWSHLQNLTFSMVIGPEKQRKKALQKKTDITLISRDNIAWLCGLYGGTSLPFEMLVIDESSSFKNNKSIRFKALKRVQPVFKRVAILTGTPAPNGLIDIWSQIYLLDRGERLSKFITKYQRTYFQRGYHTHSKHEIRDGADKAIHRKIDDICISMKGEDYLELPPKTDNYIKVNFPKVLKKRYKDFEKEQILEMFDKNNTEINAVNATALMTKLLQFANGAIYDAERNIFEIHKLKLDALTEIIEGTEGKPVLVAWSYKHDEARILKHLKAYHPVALKTDKHVRDWNKGKIRVLLMHPASGGHGLNLQEGGSTVVWFGQTWSLELYEQLNARLYRQGQKNPVIVHHIISRGTMDIKVVDAIKKKAVNQNNPMQALKARIDEYIK